MKIYLSRPLIMAALLAFVLTSSVLAQGKGNGNGNGGGGKPNDNPAYTLTDLLGFPSNGYQSRGEFILNRDSDGNTLIAGDSRLYPDPEGPSEFHPALWRIDENGNYPSTDPLDLGIPTFARGVQVAGVTSQGVVVADTQRAVEKDADGNWVFPAYVDVPGMPYQELPAPIDRKTGVSGINEDGQIIGSYQDIDPDDPTELIGVGAMWQLQADGSITGPTSLGEFFPVDINNHGVMAGRYQGWPAIAWYDGATLEIRQLDSSLRYAGARVTAINDLPIDDPGLSVVGYSFRDDAGDPSGHRGYAWRPFDDSNPTTVLGTLGGNDSRARDVNVHGQIVGVADTRRHGQQAFIYEDGEMKNLNSLVELDKQTLKEANAINDDGDIIGSMKIPRPVSESRGFLLRPIDP